MEPTLLAKISIRIVAIYLIAQGILRSSEVILIGLLPFMGNGVSVDTYLMQMMYITKAVLFTLLPLVFGLLLWMFSNKIAALIVGPKAINQPSGNKLNSLNLQAIAISTVGLVIVFTALPNLIGTVIHLNNLSNFMGDSIEMKIGDMLPAVLHGLQFVFGLLLILGTKFWVRSLHNLRVFGLHNKRS